jgi:hypothetical protein
MGPGCSSGSSILMLLLLPLLLQLLRPPWLLRRRLPLLLLLLLLLWPPLLLLCKVAIWERWAPEYTAVQQPRGCRTSLELVQYICSTAQHSTAQHSTAQHSTAQHSTAQHSTAQHSTAQHATAQHSTARHSIVQHSSDPAQWTECNTGTRVDMYAIVQKVEVALHNAGPTALERPRCSSTHWSARRVPAVVAQ